MRVKQLIEDLKKMDPEAVVGFSGNGVFGASGIRYGKREDSKVFYVLLVSKGNGSPDNYSPPTEDISSHGGMVDVKRL